MTASAEPLSSSGPVGDPEGLRQYFVQKIEELNLINAEKQQNLRRLQAQRNELNAKVRLLREELQLLVNYYNSRGFFNFTVLTNACIKIRSLETCGISEHASNSH